MHFYNKCIKKILNNKFNVGATCMPTLAPKYPIAFQSEMYYIFKGHEMFIFFVLGENGDYLKEIRISIFSCLHVFFLQDFPPNNSLFHPII